MFMDGLTFQNVRRSPFWVFSYRRWWLDFQNPSHSSARRVSSLGTCWQEESGGVEQERGSTVEPVTHGGLVRRRSSCRREGGGGGGGGREAAGGSCSFHWGETGLPTRSPDSHWRRGAPPGCYSSRAPAPGPAAPRRQELLVQQLS